MTSSANMTVHQLEEAFAAFNKVSDELGSSYRELESRVAGLTAELTAARSAKLRELAEKERLASKLSALMDALPGGVLVISPTGVIQEVNPGASELLGQTLIGEQWQEVVKRVSPDNTIHGGELSLHCGSKLSVTSSVLADVEETIILLADITESTRLNELISREQRLSALGEMAARLAHQVRTPLSSAILYLSQLNTGDSKNKHSSHISEKIMARLRQIENLVDSMLTYIRGDVREASFVSVKELLTSATDAVSTQVDLKCGLVNLQTPEMDCTIRGNREALFNALTNLLENAIQASDEPKVELGFRQHGEQIEITVKDNGPGIKSDVLEHIFDPFYSTRPQGTGLGLAVVASTAKSHCGEITVENRKKGGSAFTLRLPKQLNSEINDIGIWKTERQTQPVSVAKQGAYS